MILSFNFLPLCPTFSTILKILKVFRRWSINFHLPSQWWHLAFLGRQRWLQRQKIYLRTAFDKLCSSYKMVNLKYFGSCNWEKLSFLIILTNNHLQMTESMKFLFYRKFWFPLSYKKSAIFAFSQFSSDSLDHVCLSGLSQGASLHFSEKKQLKFGSYWIIELKIKFDHKVLNLHIWTRAVVASAFYLWQIWVQSLTVVSYLWVGQPGLCFLLFNGSI